MPLRIDMLPKACVWELTLQCNLQCLHCGSSAGPGTARDRELNTREALDFCDEAAAMGVISVTLSGGEPFLRDDWPEIVRRLHDKEVAVGIISNGLSVTDEVKQELKTMRQEGRVLTIGMSIDGPPKMHDWIRGRPGLFERTVAELQNVKEIGHNTNILTTVHKKNLDQMPALRDLVWSVKPTMWQLQVTSGYGRMKDDKDKGEWLLSLEDYARLIYFWVDTKMRSREVEIGSTDCIGYYGSAETVIRPQRAWDGCGAGIDGFGLRSNGDVVGCLSLMDDRFVEGNIREAGLFPIWWREGAFIYNRDFSASDLTDACRACPHALKCAGGCSAIADSIGGAPHRAAYCIRLAEVSAAKQSQIGQTG
ncbi:radical SAM protein [Myxococcota bacterium]